MFDKLRWKLTAFNTAVTGLVIVCLAILCLTLSERNTREQTLRNFSDVSNAVSSYLAVQDQISDAWLKQMCSDQNLHISVLDAGKPLFSMTVGNQDPEVLRDFALARDQSGLRAGRTNSRMFSMDDRYAFVSQLEKQDSVMELILLYSLEEMEQGIRQQRLLVSLAVLLAIGILIVFSWIFTGKMLRPIQENQTRQTEFVAAASHELRTPLAAILSAASAMERSESLQRAQFSDMIRREGERMSRLIGDMLTLANADNKAWNLQTEPVDLDMLLLEVYENQFTLAKQQGITLTLSLYEQEIPVLKLDKDRMAQVLSILLDNARNHAAGKIELELSVHRNRVQIRVIDNGPGVPDSEKKRIFERFYRSEKSRSDRTHFGLGLSIAAEIVKKHKGKIWVQDASAGGAEFVVELPVS